MLEGKSFQNHSIDRYTEIERENRILLEKMTNIMQNNKAALLTATSGIQPSQYQSSNQTQIGFKKNSLNREARKRELLKITMEN